MKHLKLIEPQAKYADDIWKLRQEIMLHDINKDSKFAGCMFLAVSKSAEEWIKSCRLKKNKDLCTGDIVPSNTYLAVRQWDDKVVGVIDIRHHINHPVLSTWGGHCGYSVRPSERGNGYAKEILNLGLTKARELGLTKMLITCDKDNRASEKVILANGGVYDTTITHDNSLVKRYWIEV